MEDIKTEKDYIERLSKALTHIVCRNGYIEHLHGNPEKKLYDSDMKMLNKDIHNKMYTICLMLFSNTDIGYKIFNDVLFGSWPFSPFNMGLEWDKAQIDYTIVPSKHHKNIKMLEKKMENKVFK